MDSIIRVAAVSNKVTVANPTKSAENVLTLINGLTSVMPDIILFPKNALTGGQCGDILCNKSIIKQCESAIDIILFGTKKHDCYIVIGSTIMKNAKPCDAIYVLYKGSVLKVLTNDELDCVVAVGNTTINIFFDDLGRLVLNSGALAAAGCDITLVPSYTPATASSIDGDILALKSASTATASVIAVANGGVGDTSFPLISKGYCGIFEVGEMCIFEQSLADEIVSVYDVDTDIIRANKAKNSLSVFDGEVIFKKPNNKKVFLMRHLNATPYLPSSGVMLNKYLDDLFILQANSLARRMENIGVKNLVIGVSGGLDSTIALLVCKKAMEILELPNESLHAITMQGLGTSEKTYDNATALMQGLECKVSSISIKQAVLDHLNDISHSGKHDTAYENAQARERTQILFNIANMENALVVGTGDLSEAALGFCTFGGDQLASFNVNICLTKTVIRKLVARLALTEFATIANTLTSILDTPVSPELLPLDKSGDIAQLTENILGEYELHDFFLYYFIKYNFTPKKILTYAVSAFPEKYRAEYIKEKLQIFLKRIITNQFKRSCSVDSTTITDMNLNRFSIPSDLSSFELFSSQI